MFVETNFLVGILRPLPERNAQALLDRHGVNLTIHIPWCCRSEAKRTLNRIVGDDLGFDTNMLDFARRAYSDTLSTSMKPLQELARLTREKKKEALSTLEQRIEQACAQVSMTAPA